MHSCQGPFFLLLFTGRKLQLFYQMEASVKKELREDTCSSVRSLLQRWVWKACSHLVTCCPQQTSEGLISQTRLCHQDLSHDHVSASAPTLAQPVEFYCEKATYGLSDSDVHKIRSINIFTRVDLKLFHREGIIHKEDVADYKKVEDIFIESTHEKNENIAERK